MRRSASVPKTRERANSAPFSLESEMAQQVATWLQRQGCTVRSEFHTGTGICDLVGCSWRSAAVRARLKYGQRKPIGPVLRIAIWDVVPAARGVSFDTIAAEFSDWFTRDRVQREIEALVRARYVREVRRHHYSKRGTWSPLHKSLIAVEMKLARPSEALRQAVQYLAFADQAFVALPEPMAWVVAQGRRDEFLKAGVGVLAVGRQGAEVVLRASRRTRKVPLHRVGQLHAVERIWRSYVQTISGKTETAQH